MVQKQKKQSAFQLRLQGKSYGEILKILGLPSKGTLSVWFKDLKLPPESKRLLRSKMLIARRQNLLRFNRDRTAKIINENKSISDASAAEIGKISDYELKLIGSMLYWGEGTIHHGRHRYPHLAFSNSNAQIIQVYMLFLRKILKIREERIRAGIHIHPNIKEKAAREFWSQITGVPESKFYIIRQISRLSKFKRSKKFLPYGTIQIRVSPERQLFYQVKGYIDGIAKQLIVQNPIPFTALSLSRRWMSFQKF